MEQFSLLLNTSGALPLLRASSRVSAYYRKLQVQIRALVERRLAVADERAPCLECSRRERALVNTRTVVRGSGSPRGPLSRGRERNPKTKLVVGARPSIDPGEYHRTGFFSVELTTATHFMKHCSTSYSLKYVSQHSVHSDSLLLHFPFVNVR